MPNAAAKVFQALQIKEHSFAKLFINIKEIEIPKELILFERKK